MMAWSNCCSRATRIGAAARDESGKLVELRLEPQERGSAGEVRVPVQAC